VDHSHLTGKVAVCFLCDPDGAEIHKNMGEHMADQHPEILEQVANAPIVVEGPVVHHCPECGKSWRTNDDPNEWVYGHDCEAS
jgi:hypothetical protein